MNSSSCIYWFFDLIRHQDPDFGSGGSPARFAGLTTLDFGFDSFIILQSKIILNTPFYRSGLHVDNGVKLFFIVGVEPGHDFYQ